MALHGHDYAAAKADILKGLTIKQVAAARNIPYQTLQKYAIRHHWTIDRTRIGQVVHDKVSIDLCERATSWLSKIDRTVHAAMDNVIKRGLDNLTLRDLSIALDCADKANRIARQTYGLDSDGTAHKVQVNVAVLGNASAVASDSDVIDIDSLSAPSLPA